MRVGVVKETKVGEGRVALVPAILPSLIDAGFEVLVQAGAGETAGFPDQAYEAKGATIVADRSEVLAADILVQVNCLGTNPERGRSDLDALHDGQTVIGLCDPLGAPEAVRELADKGVTLFAMEMIPRITRAQSMDVLSSMATIAGYRAVLLAAVSLPKMFPMMMTAAGTVKAAKVFVIGAGVAGLQAIATSRRLGGIVSAYDVRPVAREQVESLGGKFVELDLESDDAETKGGYAKAMDEAFYEKQRALMARVVAESDVVITTAAIPGRPSPRLITADAVQGMMPGSVIVDLAAERGGNCELSQPDQTVVEHGITILGPTNLPGEVANHASQMYSKNLATFLLHLAKDQQLDIDQSDEITRETLVAQGSEVVHPRLRDLLGLDPRPEPQEKETASETPQASSNAPLPSIPLDES